MFTASSPTPPPPRTLDAQIVQRESGTPRPGTRVSPGEVGYPRVFANRRDGLAIGGSQLGGGITFAAITTDGGRVWFQSPTLFTASADAPNDITSVVMDGARTDVVYGTNCVDTSSNSGRTWYRAYFPDQLVAVVPSVHGLAAYEQISNSSGQVTATVQYVSRDGGRQWRLSDTAGG